MKITDKDKVFYFCSKDDNVPESDISYYGWSKNMNLDFGSYINGYKYAAESTYNAFRNCNNLIEIQDTICYPLVFLYRHIVELYLKYAYIEIKKRDDSELKCFFEKCGHNLLTIWSRLKPDIEFLSERINLKVDIGAIEHYIQSLNNEDKLSFNYRYPITKEGDIIHNHSSYLNVKNLHDKMNSFFSYIEYMITGLSGQLLFLEYNEEFKNLFLKELKNSETQIRKYIKLKDEFDLKDKKGIGQKAWISLSDIPEEDDNCNEKEIEFINGLSENQKTIFILLYLLGKDINLEKLAYSKNERLKDIFRLIYYYTNNEINLESKANQYKDSILYDYIFCRRKSIEYIQIALQELGREL